MLASLCFYLLRMRITSYYIEIRPNNLGITRGNNANSGRDPQSNFVRRNGAKQQNDDFDPPRFGLLV
jgi:hypothetical protein